MNLQRAPQSEFPPPTEDAVELPAPTPAPLVLALGLAVGALGIPFGATFGIVGGLLFCTGLTLWIGQLLPGRGHVWAPLEERPTPVVPRLGAVQPLLPGVPGYRFRLPEKVHPLSAGIKGGLAGGLVMPIPALLYGVISGHGIWYPVNLLTAMVVPGVDRLTIAELEQFHLTLFIGALLIHVVLSLIIGLMSGAILPTLPDLPLPVAWGCLLMPLLWTTLSYFTMGFVNPLLSERVDWTWYILSQFLFGVGVAATVLITPRGTLVRRSIIGGWVGGVIMALPALLWAVATGRSVWYPANLLTAMVRPDLRMLPAVELDQFHLDWFALAIGVHVIICTLFGLIFGLILPRVPRVPSPLTWGGLVFPLMWTGLSYGLMGVVNPLLADRVDWPWFIASQFIFGIVASIVIIRTAMVHIPPAGLGPSADTAAATEWITE